jgi:hypothetical protein
MKRAGEVVARLASSHHNDTQELSSWLHHPTKNACELLGPKHRRSGRPNRLALAAVKAGIQAKGQRKLSTYSRAELTMMTNALIAPWFIEQVRAKIAERNSKVMSKDERPAMQGLPLNECHAQNGAGE